MTQINRVLEHFRNEEKKGIVCIAIWTLEDWAIYQTPMTVGSACRHARTLVFNKDLEHPVIDGKVNKHYFRLTEQGKNKKILECPKSYQGVGNERCWNCKEINNCKYKISATSKSDSEETPGEQNLIVRSHKATVKSESKMGLGGSGSPSGVSQMELKI